jgi:hypothetical protein
VTFSWQQRIRGKRTVAIGVLYQVGEKLHQRDTESKERYWWEGGRERRPETARDHQFNV